MSSRMRRKGDLPTKPCAVCGRPFQWRKKWAGIWDEVKYCSDACRSQRRRFSEKPPPSNPPTARG
ncbi:MAG TPA: DUF2256 domain-containing protein [Skermanella sp.]|nr:DUF2256 domain-containing protein [Skermanella sp.]